MNKNIKITIYFPDEYSENPDKLRLNFSRDPEYFDYIVEDFLEERDQKVLKSLIYRIIKKIEGE